MRDFAIKKFAVILACFILLCIVVTVSARGMFNVPNTKTEQVKRSLGDENSSDNNEDFKKCLICGKRHSGPEENIARGKEVQTLNKYPWMVKLKLNESGDPSSECCGAILSEYYILTASHCFNSKRKNCLPPVGNGSCAYQVHEIQIFFLSFDAIELTKGPPVEEYFTHPELSKVWHNDIGIIKLQSPITCNEFASPICLPPADFSVPEKSMFGTSGWGASEYPG